MKISAVYSGVPADVGAARRLVAEHLDHNVPSETSAVALLLTSELVTNAVLHTRSAFLVQVEVRPDAIRVEVDDDSVVVPALRPLTAMDEHGRGLRLMVAFASRWGCRPNAVGKSIWFELDR